MRNFPTITAYHYTKEDRVKTTTKLRGRRRTASSGKTSRGKSGRLLRSVRDLFTCCWGRRDDVSVKEHERLLFDDQEGEYYDHDDDDDQQMEEAGHSDDESDLSSSYYSDSDSESERDDERLMGAEDGGNVLVVPSRHTALSFFRPASRTSISSRGSGRRGWGRNGN